MDKQGGLQPATNGLLRGNGRARPVAPARNQMLLALRRFFIPNDTTPSARHGALAVRPPEPVACRAVLPALHPLAGPAHPLRPHKGPQGLPFHARRV